jgi:hypothetical protein
LFFFVASSNTLFIIFIYLQETTMELGMCCRCWGPCFPILFGRLLVVHFSDAVVLLIVWEPSCF